jgi:hypothetical protein
MFQTFALLTIRIAQPILLIALGHHFLGKLFWWILALSGACALISIHGYQGAKQIAGEKFRVLGGMFFVFTTLLFCLGVAAAVDIALRNSLGKDVAQLVGILFFLIECYIYNLWYKRKK